MSDLRVWVGCLACYNDGMLVGEWVDASEAGEYRPHLALGNPDRQIIASHLNRLHEETWCFDHEGFPAGTGEMSPMEAQRIAEALEGLMAASCADAPAVFAYADNMGQSVTDVTVSDFDDAYNGEWKSEEDFASEMADELILHSVSDDFARYFDYEAWTRDLFMSDYWSAPADGGGVYVFRNQ